MNIFVEKITMKNSSLFLLVTLAFATRILPHPPNMTAVSALALLTGVAISSRMVAIFVPLVALFLSDLVLGFHDQMWAVYVAVALITLWSRGMLAKQSLFANSKMKILGVSVASSLVFFVITNLAVWWQSAMYQHNWAGLTNCFLMALPFLGNQLAADLVYATIFLGSFAIWQRQQIHQSGKVSQFR